MRQGSLPRDWMREVEPGCGRSEKAEPGPAGAWLLTCLPLVWDCQVRTASSWAQGVSLLSQLERVAQASTILKDRAGTTNLPCWSPREWGIQGRIFSFLFLSLFSSSGIYVHISLGCFLGIPRLSLGHCAKTIRIRTPRFSVQELGTDGTGYPLIPGHMS